MPPPKRRSKNLSGKSEKPKRGAVRVPVDITESKRTEEALQAREAQLRSFLQHVPAAIAMFDRKMNYLAVSERWMSYFGQGHRDLVGLNHYEAHPDVPERWKEIHRKGLAGETHSSDEDIWVRADGNRIWSSWTVSPWRDANDNIGGIIILAEDITQQKTAETKLSESEERMHLMIESVKDCAIIMLDTDGRVVSWNPGAERIKGYRAEEIIGQHFSCFYLEDKIREGFPEKELRAATEKGHFEDEGWRLRKDGSRFWASVVVSAVRNALGELLGFVKLTRDLTERKRAEQALLKSQHMFEGLFENSPDTVILVNQAGCIVRVNARAEALFGYTRVELEGRSIETLIPERYRARHGGQLAGYFAAPRVRPSSSGLELFAMRKDGSEFPADIMLSPLETDEGTHAMAAIRDITARKEAEEHIHNLNKELKQRANMLEVSNRELEAFCYSVSHDLRAPLRGIDGFSHALLEDYTDKIDAPGRDYLQRIRGGCQRMAQLIDDLLNLSRLSRAEMHLRPVDLSKLAREVTHELRETAPERVVQFHIAEDLKTVGDRGLLRVALWNLLGNAWKFTGKAAAAVIEFGVRRSDGQAIYFVRDNGPGFDMTYADKLFKPFQRLHAMTEFPGSGIGLATVGRVIHRHGGRVWVEAAPGQGATFFFTLEQEGEQHGQR